MNDTALRYPVFAEVFWPEKSMTRDVFLVVAGSWLMAAAAQVQIPLWPVPVTGQTFGMLLLGALLGSRKGAAAMLAYLGQGAVGLPFFAGGAAGLARLAGPTGGYLGGMVLTAFLVGFLCERGWDRRFYTAVPAMLAGNLILYAFGLPWLALFVGWGQVVEVGFLPFVSGDILKIVLAAVALPLGWRVLKRDNAA